MLRYLLFDLGETLIEYFSREEFRGMLPAIFESLYSALLPKLTLPKEHYWDALLQEDHESPDYSVRPMEGRLASIFQLPAGSSDVSRLCELFMQPLLRGSHPFPDTVEALEALSQRYRLGIVSNTPWGSPKDYFEADLERHGIGRLFPHRTYCRDVGYRKPHRIIFEHALGEMGAVAEQTVMIGDRYQWDIVGARSCGITGILVDRDAKAQDDCLKVGTLLELADMIGRAVPA